MNTHRAKVDTSSSSYGIHTPYDLAAGTVAMNQCCSVCAGWVDMQVRHGADLADQQHTSVWTQTGWTGRTCWKTLYR